jgi:two-component system, cell cycle sensor histidine kinase and response regulator CckA
VRKHQVMNKSLRVLHVEDSERDVALLTRHLSRAGYELISARVDTPEAMRDALETREWDVILCDYSMPHFNALGALKLIKEIGLDIPFIIISGTIGEEIAVEAMRAGAHDYLMKDKLARLAPAIERELAEFENHQARRQAEAALRESEQRLRGVTETARVGLVMVDENHRYRYANRTYAEIFGLPTDDLVGRQVSEVLAPVYAEQIRPRLERAFQGERVHYELVIPPSTEGGEERYYEVTYEPGSEREGAIVVVVVVDITERKLAEKALGESERFARAVVDALSAHIAILDESGVIVAVNRAWKEFASQNGASFNTACEGANYLEVCDSVAGVNADAKACAEGIRAISNSRLDKFVHEYPCHSPTEQRWFVVRVTRFPGKGSKRVVVAHENITERKRAEQELIRSEESYRDLVENAHDIIYSHDLEGNYISVNKAAEQITGYTREESLSMNLAQMVAPEYLEKARQMIAGKLAGERVTAYELEIIAKDGRRVAVEVNSKLILHDSVPVGVQGIARDVTERKQLEAQFRQSQKMEAIEQLAGGVAHDFNNLLTVVNGYSDLALMRLQTEDPLRRNIEEIKKAGVRAASLTRQLLAFSRKQVLQPKVLNINSVVSDMDKMLRRLIGEDVGLKTITASELGSIKADPGQIEQVLMNLAINARDAMPQGGKLTIETENVYLDEEYARQHIAVNPGPYVMLAVSDTGTGMDKTTQARIFEPFFTTKAADKGTGLGLSTVYGIIKQSGGNIWVYSEIGQGTTFKIYLPRIDEGAQDYKRSTEVEEVFHGTETILLAEDEEMVRNLAREVLETYGYHVLEAANGGSALLICERHQEPIQLLITDVVMPEMSGRELADRLSQLRPEMKVLYMSGYTDNAIVHQGVLDAGANFIQKPFAPQQLARKVREVLGEERRGS